MTVRPLVQLRRVDVSPTTSAYVAGIIDGEGCITLNRYRPPRADLSVRYTPLVQVGNTNSDLTTMLERIFGGHVNVRPGTTNHRACFVWVITGPGAGITLRSVREYLQLKRLQCDLLLEYLDGFRSFRGGPRSRRVATDELARRERIYLELKALNRTGPR